MMNKHEAVRAILDGQGADRIPVMMNIGSLSFVRYGYDMFEVMTNPEKFVDAICGTQEELGFDGLLAGLMVAQLGDVAGHLPRPDGEISGDGQDTIHSVEDLEKLKPFDLEACMNLQGILANIALMKERAPEEPLYVIILPPAGEALNAMGARFAFKNMVKHPELFRAVAEYFEDMQYRLSKRLWEAGVDFLWFPEPNFGGACISRRAYEKCISESNIRFFNRLRNEGIRFVLHTCGPYDDRFDLVLKESAYGWHISDTQTKKVKEEYGDKISLMGNIPSVRIMLESSEQEVYDFAYQECMDAAYDGRFILSGDCDLPPQTPDENIRAAVRAAREAEKVLFGE